MKKVNRLIGAVIPALLLWTGMVFSQSFESLPDGPPRVSEDGRGAGPSGDDLSGLPPEQRREEIGKRIELMRMLRLSQELNLNEEMATKVFSRLRPIDQKRRGRIQEHQRIQRGLREASDSGKIDEKKLQELMKSLRENRQAMMELDQEEIQALGGLLTPQQMAKYLLFREGFRQELRQEIERFRGSQGSQPGQGPRGPRPQDRRFPE
ncbi:MAG: hypothetical protein HYR80_08045 [Nitrospirae bacterium]|nr:hypothetical protein [Nitrospirota bacterium]